MRESNCMVYVGAQELHHPIFVPLVCSLLVRADIASPYASRRWSTGCRTTSNARPSACSLKHDIAQRPPPDNPCYGSQSQSSLCAGQPVAQRIDLAGSCLSKARNPVSAKPVREHATPPRTLAAAEAARKIPEVTMSRLRAPAAPPRMPPGSSASRVQRDGSLMVKTARHPKPYNSPAQQAQREQSR